MSEGLTDKQREDLTTLLRTQLSLWAENNKHMEMVKDGIDKLKQELNDFAERRVDISLEIYEIASRLGLNKVVYQVEGKGALIEKNDMNDYHIDEVELL